VALHFMGLVDCLQPVIAVLIGCESRNFDVVS